MTRRVSGPNVPAEQLRESEQWYRRLFEEHPHPMWVYDLETFRFLAVNDAAVAKYGYTRDEFLGMRITDIRPQEDIPALLESIRTLAPGMRTSGVWRHRTKDGRLLTVEISTHSVEFAGRPGSLVQALDITARVAAEEALAVERDRLEAAQRVAKVGSWETDLVTLKVLWSAETFRIFGLDPATFQPAHETFLEHVHPADRELVDRAFRDSFATREICAVIHRILLRDGTEKHIEERWRTFVDAAGVPIRAAGTCQDITNRVEAAAALEQGMSLLRVASSMSRLGAFSVDLLTGVRFWSEELSTIFDLEPGQTPPLEEALAHYPPADRGRMRSAYEGCATKGIPYDLELEATTRTGRRIWVRTIGEAVRNNQGTIVGIRGATQDITDRRLAAEALRLSEERFRQSFAGAPVGMFLTDRTGAFLEANAAFCLMLGYRADELRTRTFAHLTHPDDMPVSQDALRELSQGGAGSTTFEKRYLHRDGHPVWVRLSVTAHRDDAGPVINFIGVVEDITASRVAAEALRVSEERFRVVFEEAGIAIALVDASDGRIVRGNGALATMLGYELAELTRLTVEMISETTEYQEDREQWERLVRGEIPRYQMAKRYYRKDGKVLWGFLTCTLIRDEAGRPRFILGMVEDITSARATQEALRNSEQRLQLLVEATNDALYEWDLVTDALTWNDGFGIQFGYARGEMDPTLAFFNARVHPDDQERITREMQGALAGLDRTWAGEYRFQRGDGRYAYVLDRGHILRDEAGRATRMVGGLTDLTDRKAAEERLEQQATLLDAAHDAILVKDLDDRITYWNKGAERTFGWMAHEAIGRRSADLFHIDPSSYREANTALLSQGQWEGELVKRGRDGLDRNIAVRWTLVRDGQGRPRSVFAIDADVTERKRLEMQFLRAQRLESLGTLAGGIAHDLNNVLAPILISIELLRMDDRDPGRLESLATIEASAKRGAAMVQQVLTFARGVEGKRLPIDAGRVAREVERIARDTFPKDITIRVSVAPDLWPITADATQIHQILTNLCVNARDAMPKGGTLTIALVNAAVDEGLARMHPDARAGRYVVLTVGDTGVGIPQAVQQRLFEPFFTTKEVGKGTGLGLSTVHSIVRSHGGFIDVHSEPGRGAQFVVHLPASSNGQMAAPAVPESPLPRGHGELILVVDDEESIRSIVQRTLERFGYRVLQAADGAEGLMVYREQRGAIDVILTDMAMPVMGGPAMIAELLTIDPKIRIVASSGLTSGGSVADALAAGVTDFVSKPYTAEVLLSTLQRVLRERPRDP
jgi:PAS domain S-box-containing protein